MSKTVKLRGAPWNDTAPLYELPVVTEIDAKLNRQALSTKDFEALGLDLTDGDTFEHRGTWYGIRCYSDNYVGIELFGYGKDKGAINEVN